MIIYWTTWVQHNRTVCLFLWHPHPQATSLSVCIALITVIYQSFFFKLINPATGGNNRKPGYLVFIFVKKRLWIYWEWEVEGWKHMSRWTLKPLIRIIMTISQRLNTICTYHDLIKCGLEEPNIRGLPQTSCVAFYQKQ